MKLAWCETRGSSGKHVLRKRAATTQLLLTVALQEGGPSTTAGSAYFLSKARLCACECPGSGPDFPGSNSGQLLNLLGHQFCHPQNGDKYCCQNAQLDCNNHKISEKPDWGNILQTTDLDTSKTSMSQGQREAVPTQCNALILDWKNHWQKGHDWDK